MKRVIHIPKTNIVRVKKTINNAFPGYPIYLSSEDIFNKEFKNIDIVSENIIKMREFLEMDNDSAATKKDSDLNNFSNDLDIPRSKSDEGQENRETDDGEDNYDSPEFDTDIDENEEE